MSKSYVKLLKDMKTLIEKGRGLIPGSAVLAVVENNHDKGKMICENMDLIKSVSRLAEDLGMEKSELNRARDFYRTWKENYPRSYHDVPISWSHHVKALMVKNRAEREFYLKQSCLNRWTRDELARRIKHGFYQEYMAQKGVERDALLQKKQNLFYLYSADVVRVIDGDTVMVDVDLGFEITVRKRVRLRGIDCPELSTKKGQTAKEFVEKEFERCVQKSPDPSSGRARVVIQTFKRVDLYGRYVCDVYYWPGETDKESVVKKGKLLNEVLLKEGLARVFE